MQRNKVTLIGYVGKDIASIKTENGNKRVCIRVATHHRKKNKENKVEIITTWHTVIAWNNSATYAQRSFVKGSKILVEGFIQYLNYKDASGNTHNITQVRAQNLMNPDR